MALNKTLAQALEFPVIVGGYNGAINLNKVGDTPIAINNTMSGYYRISNIIFVNNGQRPAILNASVGLYLGQNQNGLAFLPQTKLTGLTSNLPNTAGGIYIPTITTFAYLNVGTLYANVGVAEGAGATVAMLIQIAPEPGA